MAKAKSAKSSYRIRVKGEGSVNVEGSETFVAAAAKLLHVFAAQQLMRHVEARVAAGDDRSTVVADVLKQLDDGVKASMKKNRAKLKVVA